jgi:predicted methyltransferase
MNVKWTSFVLLLSIAAVGAHAQASDTVADSATQAVADARRPAPDRERDETSRPEEVLRFFGVRPGMHVLDLLSGGGYYSEILAYAVGPAGVVVAHTNDIYEKYAADEIADRYRGGRLPNVERLVSNESDLKLGEERFDLVFMAMVYHDVYYVSAENPRHPKIDRDRYFAQIRRSLKPGGVLAVLDHAAKPGTGKDAAQDLHRIDEAFARQDIEAAGFEFEQASDVLRNPDDDRSLLVFDDRIRRRTDRFVYRFRKPR